MIDRQVSSAMDVWEWMTYNVKNPAAYTPMVNRLSDMFDTLGRDHMQELAKEIGELLSDFFMSAAHDDWELLGGPYEDYVEDMLGALYWWHGDIRKPSQSDMAVAYTYVSNQLKYPRHFNEFLSMRFEWRPCGEFLDNCTGESFVEEWEPEDGVWTHLSLLDSFHTVYGAGPDELPDALVDFPPGPWAEMVYKTLLKRQEELRDAA